MKKVTANQRNNMLTALLRTAQGRGRIAATIQEPLRTLRDYESVGRRFLLVDELPDGTTPIYDMDPMFSAYVVAEEADSIEVFAKSKRLLVPMYELAANPQIPFSQVKERRFDVVKRVKERAKIEIFRREDRLIFSTMAAAATASNRGVDLAPITTTAAAFGWEDIIEGFSVIEGQGLRVDKIAMHPSLYKVVRKAGREYLDFETQREILRTGLMATAYGAQIYQSIECPKDTVIFSSEPEYVGVMPIGIDLTVIPADEPKHRAFGWSAFTHQGTAVHNPLGVSAIKITG